MGIGLTLEALRRRYPEAIQATINKIEAVAGRIQGEVADLRAIVAGELVVQEEPIIIIPPHVAQQVVAEAFRNAYRELAAANQRAVG